MPWIVETELARSGGPERPVRPGDLRAGAEPRRLYVAIDGSRAVHVFDDSDADAAGRVGQAADARGPCWAATVKVGRGRDADSAPAPTEPGHSLVIVERSFAEPVDFDHLQAMEDAGRSCFKMRAISFLGTYFALDGRRMLCLYAAPDAESVRSANRQAGLAFDAAWAARVLDDG